MKVRPDFLEMSTKSDINFRWSAWFVMRVSMVPSRAAVMRFFRSMGKIS